MLKKFFKIGVIAVGACFVFAWSGSAKAEVYKVTKKGTPTYTNAPVKITPSTKVIDNEPRSSSAAKSGGSANKQSSAISWKKSSSSVAESAEKQGGSQNASQKTEENQEENKKRASSGDLGPPR